MHIRYSPHLPTAGNDESGQFVQIAREMRGQSWLNEYEQSTRRLLAEPMAMRVSQFLCDQQVSFEEMIHPPTYTSQKLARFLHIPGRQVMKSVLLKGPRDFILAVLPASHRIDLTRLSAHFGGPVRLATVTELRDLFPDCEYGALMPFGRLYDVPTILETTIPMDTTIVFEAQQHAVAIRMSCRDFVKLEQPERIHFACTWTSPGQQPPKAG